MVDARDLAVSSWSWHAPYYAGTWSLLDLPTTAVDIPLTHIEANDFMLPPPRLSRLRQPLLRLLPGAPPELWRYSRPSLHQLRANAQAHGTKLVAWTINSDFTVPAHHWPAQSLYLRRGLAAARFLEVPLLRLNLGGTADTPASYDPRLVQRLSNFAQNALNQVSGLTLTIENHWGVSSDPARHIRLLDEVAARLSPSQRVRFGACFDPANLPNAPERPAWWAALAKRANHYHLKTGRFDEAGEELTLPHASLVALLKKVHYHGRVTIEYTGDEPPLAGVRQSVRLWEKLTG